MIGRLRPCKHHASWTGVQRWEPRADGYCTYACRAYGVEEALKALLAAVYKEVPDDGCYSEVYARVLDAEKAL